MDEADRLAAQAEADDPTLLPPGATVVPELLAQRELLTSPVAQMLAEIHAVARQGTPSDQPVPPERFEWALLRYGLGGHVFAYLMQLYKIDGEWLAGAASVRKRHHEEARAKAER